MAAQTTTGAFMTITSSEEAKLVGARSSIAKTTQIHQSMLMDGVNHMHPTEAVALPAGKSIELTVEDKRGKRSKIEVQAEVRPLGQ